MCACDLANDFLLRSTVTFVKVQHYVYNDYKERGALAVAMPLILSLHMLFPIVPHVLIPFVSTIATCCLSLVLCTCT